MTTINNTAAQTASTAAATTKSSAAGKLTQDYDSFLKLLTTQMQNQDPLSPTESTEFTNQLVQFSQVEQQINQNEKLEKLLTMQSNNQTQASLGFIGLDVEATGNAFSYDGSPVKMSYTLPEASTSTTIQIKNDKGVIVRTIEGSRSTSRQELTWDGRKSDGSTAAAGDYSMSVVAPNASAKLMTAATTTFGRVSGIESGNGVTTLLMGNTPIKMENVLSARPPAAAAA
jgi:flagellar basal-body rod modification protein FlgD